MVAKALVPEANIHGKSAGSSICMLIWFSDCIKNACILRSDSSLKKHPALEFEVHSVCIHLQSDYFALCEVQIS